ncbi:MAG: hypothetical protein R2798_09995 [Chitinophagales bacterium]|nr:hypothetical protein [Bacteroidota bacterium]MCB9044482.1 hypothetical protein [Chitinophagales bacterium]
MKDVIKQKFLEAFYYLYDRRYFKNKKSFAEELDITPQFLSQLLNDKTPIPLDLLSNFFNKYPVNPGFFFKGEANILLPDAVHPIEQQWDMKGNNATNATSTGSQVVSNTSSMGNYMDEMPPSNFPTTPNTAITNDLDFEIARALENSAKAHLELVNIITQWRGKFKR